MSTQPTLTQPPGLILDGIPPGESDELTAPALDRTAAACAWLLPLAETTVKHLEGSPIVVQWLRSLLAASEDGLTERLQ